MSDLQDFVLRVAGRVYDGQYRREVEDVVRDHLESAAEVLTAAGTSPEAAEQQAMAAFGDPECIGVLLNGSGKGGPSMRWSQVGGLASILAGLGGLAFVINPGGLLQRLLNTGAFGLGAEILARLLSGVFLLLFSLTLYALYVRHPASARERIPIYLPVFTGVGITLAGQFVPISNVWAMNVLGTLFGYFGLIVVGVSLARHSGVWRGAPVVFTGLCWAAFNAVVRVPLTPLPRTLAIFQAAGWVWIGLTLLSPWRAPEQPQRTTA